MPSSRHDAPRPGSLRSFIGGVFSLLLTRAELLALEAEEQKDRLLAALFLGGLALVLLLIGLLAALLLVAVLTPEAVRPWLLGGFMLIGLGGGLALLARLRRQAHDSQPPFAATFAEVRKDWDSLSGRS